MKLPIFDAPRGKSRPIMDDFLWWETPEDYASPEDHLMVEEKKGKLLNDNHDDTNV